MKDINRDMQFRTTRVVNPLDPRYFLQSDESKKAHEYGEIVKSEPKRLHPISVNKNQDFTLHTDDIEGAVASTKGNKAIISKTRKDFRIINKTDDVGGAQVGTLKKGIVTLRCVNPVVPVYQYPGRTEPTIYDQHSQGNPSSLSNGKGQQSTVSEKLKPRETEEALKEKPATVSKEVPSSVPPASEASIANEKRKAETPKQAESQKSIPRGIPEDVTVSQVDNELAPLKQRKWETGNQLANEATSINKNLELYASGTEEPIQKPGKLSRKGSRSSSGSGSRLLNRENQAKEKSVTSYDWANGGKKVAVVQHQTERLKQNEFEKARKTFFGVENEGEGPFYVPGTMKRDHLLEDKLSLSKMQEKLSVTRAIFVR